MVDARVPTQPTLKKYGLTADEWQSILDSQGGGCGVCGNVPPSGTLHIDHDHVKGWKSMSGTERRQYVRGIICWFDNNVLLRRGASPSRLRAAADYLERYENKPYGS
jgi:hypothetical protein